MGELTWLVDATTGQLVVEGLAQDAAPALVGDLLGDAVLMGCSKPPALIHPLRHSNGYRFENPVQISGYYHDSLVEGPGRRSVARFQGCPIRCPGCWVPETWDEDAGHQMEVADLAMALLDPAHQRDGITILGGEPFAQPHQLADLIGHFPRKTHVVVYSGYTYEQLQRKRKDIFDIQWLLEYDWIDLLIDGPYVAKLAPGGPWTGSTNQRVIDMNKTRAAGKVVLYAEPD